MHRDMKLVSEEYGEMRAHGVAAGPFAKVGVVAIAPPVPDFKIEGDVRNKLRRRWELKDNNSEVIGSGTIVQRLEGGRRVTGTVQEVVGDLAMVKFETAVVDAIPVGCLTIERRML